MLHYSLPPSLFSPRRISSQIGPDFLVNKLLLALSPHHAAGNSYLFVIFFHNLRLDFKRSFLLLGKKRNKWVSWWILSRTKYSSRNIAHAVLLVYSLSKSSPKPIREGRGQMCAIHRHQPKQTAWRPPALPWEKRSLCAAAECMRMEKVVGKKTKKPRT